MRLDAPQQDPRLFMLVVGLAVALLLGFIERQHAATLDERLTAAEVQIGHLQDATMTWAGVAQEALSLAVDNVGMCRWTLLPAKNERELLDAMLVACPRRDGCQVEWTIRDAADRVGTSCDWRVRVGGAP